VKATLKRPALLDLNNAVPLTFQVRGVKADKVLRVNCATANAQTLEPGAVGYRFDLPHDRAQALPQRMALLEFKPGEMGLKQHSAFPGLNVRFEPEGDHLRCLLKNGITTLRQLRVTCRLPLLYQRGVVREFRAKLGNNETLDFSIPLALSEESDGFKYQSGEAWFYAQLDFVQDGVPGRLHVVCHRPEAEADAGYPRDGFAVLGPLPDDDPAADDLAATLATTPQMTEPVALAGGGSKAWQVKDRTVTQLLDPEYICTRGESSADQPEYYLLRTRLVAEKPQKLTAVAGVEQMTAMFLNGRRLGQNTLELNAGDNDLLLVYYSGKEKFSARYHGAFLRLIDPATGRRATTVRYQRPAVATQE
jgi:hypothetical protein